MLCPACHRSIGERYSIVEDPRPDDPTVCASCATVLVFNADLGVRVAEVGDWQRDHPVVRRVRHAVEAVLAERR
jgi:hypothetical protein